MKKGQTAMEYLMTYGWAILIVIVVIAALYSMGVFTLTGGVPCSPCFSEFSYIDHDDTNLRLRNGARQMYFYNGSGAFIGLFNASDDITFTHGCTSWPCELTITFNVTASYMNHTDSGTLQQSD